MEKKNKSFLIFEDFVKNKEECHHVVGDNANLQDVMIMMTLKSYKLNLESGEGIFASSSHSTADLLFFFFFFRASCFFSFLH